MFNVPGRKLFHFQCYYVANTVQAAEELQGYFSYCYTNVLHGYLILLL